MSFSFSYQIIGLVMQLSQLIFCLKKEIDWSVIENVINFEYLFKKCIWVRSILAKISQFFFVEDDYAFFSAATLNVV